MIKSRSLKTQPHTHTRAQSLKALIRIVMFVGWVSDFATLHFCMGLLGGMRDAGGPHYNYIVLHNIKNLGGWEQSYLTDSKGGGPWTGYMILDKWDVKPFGDNGGGDVAIQADSPNSPVCWGEERGCGCGGQPCDDMLG